MPDYRLAPELVVEQWLNTPTPITLESLRGKVVVLEAFQMLCPGCVTHSIPQALRVRDAFPENLVSVIGLHTVFEHHSAMGKTSLEAFVHEFRVLFPVAIDRPSESGRVPQTMGLYGMQGTPTTVLIDKRGRLRKQTFGRIDDLLLGAEIATLLSEPAPEASTDCEPNGCRIA